MLSVKDKERRRKLRHERIRRDLRGTPRKPRLCVKKSNRHFYAQIVNDFEGHTVAAASTLDPEIRDEVSGNNMEAAQLVGELIAHRALEKGTKEVVFDRSGYPYHGKVKAVAEKAREEGLEL